MERFLALQIGHHIVAVFQRSIWRTGLQIVTEKAGGPKGEKLEYLRKCGGVLLMLAMFPRFGSLDGIYLFVSLCSSDYYTFRSASSLLMPENMERAHSG